MAVYSKRFYGPAKPSSTSVTTLYTVPSGRTALIKELSIANISASVALLLRMFVDIGPGMQEWGRWHLAGNGSNLILPIRLVLEEGQLLGAQRDHTTMEPRLLVNGYEFIN